MTLHHSHQRGTTKKSYQVQYIRNVIGIIHPYYMEGFEVLYRLFKETQTKEIESLLRSSFFGRWHAPLPSPWRIYLRIHYLPTPPPSSQGRMVDRSWPRGSNMSKARLSLQNSVRLCGLHERERVQCVVHLQRRP